MSTALIQPSFAAGELAPSLYARVDLAKWHVAAAVMRNCFVDYKGGAASRGGSRFINKSFQVFGTPPRLVPFQFSQTQTYVLEMGNQYIRFIQNGGYILENGINISAITNANPGVITATAHGFSNGDWVQLAGIGGMTQLNGKTFVVANVTTNTFTLVDLWGVAVNTTSFGVYTSGGTASRYYTITSPYAVADLPLLKWVQSADTLTLTHPSYNVQQLKRLAQTNWTLTALNLGAKISPPTGVSAAVQQAAATTNGVANYSYVVTAVSNTGEESIASSSSVIQNGIIEITQGSNVVTWSAVANAIEYNVYRASPAFAATGPAPAVPVGALYGLIGTTTGLQLVDGNINPDFTQTPPTHQDPFAPGAIQFVFPLTGGSGYSAATTATVSDPTGTGAILQPIIIGGVIQGYLVLNGGKNYTSPSIVYGSTGGGTGATVTFTVGPLTGTTPGVTNFFQQRQYYANSINLPVTFWATKPGNFANMDVSNPTRDSDAIVDTIASQQVNGIQFLVSMPTGLVILTGLGAWQLTGGIQSSAVTPSTATATAQAYNGCHSHVPPIVVNYDIIYLQEKGSIYRDLAYNFFVNIYTGTDLTILSNHLFTGHQIIENCWSEEPYKILWATRDDGVLLSMTYLKEQDVYAWARHDTFGLFISLASVSEFTMIDGFSVGTNAVYTVVQRFINGQWVYYIERFDSRIWNTVEDVWAVDAGLQTVPNATPNATLTFSASSGNGVTATSSASAFNSGMVGNVIRAGGGIFLITGFTSATVVTGNFTQAMTAVLANDPNNTPIQQTSGQWAIWTKVASVSGLDHLNGAIVSVLADGSVMTPRQVVNGSVNLDVGPNNTPLVSKVTIGLGFQAQIQSLNVDSGNPTIQGKRKNIPALTARVVNSRGVKMGRTFATVVEHKDRGNSVFADTAIPLFTGDIRMVLDAQWDVPGQVCLQQDYPLPMNVLGIIPEINAGDTNG